MSQRQDRVEDDPPRSGALRRGPVLMALAALVFTVMVALVKVVRTELAATDIIVWRSLVGVPLALLGLRGLSPLPVSRKTLTARILLGFAAMICFFTAAKGLALADHSLISKVQPLLVAVVAPWILGADERPDPRIWSALLLGLVGCVVLLAPELQGGSVWGLWAVAAAVFSAGAHTCLRALGRTDHPAVVVLWFQLGIVPLSLLLHVATTGASPALPDTDLWLPIAGIGACAVLGQTLMTRAYQLDRAALVAGAAYTAPLWAVAGDAIWWGLAPAWTTMVGGAVIVLAGIIVTLRRQAA